MKNGLCAKTFHIIDKINSYKTTKPDVIACCNYLKDGIIQQLTYSQLVDYSDRLAFYLQEKLGKNKKPIVVYGHKNPYMLVCFLACVKSGRAYVPVDISVSNERVKNIIDSTNTPLVLCTESMGLSLDTVIDFGNLKNIIDTTTQKIDIKYYVKDEDVFYIIFTSGSTGSPKGVQITESCLCNFIQWAVTLGNKSLEDKQITIINQAPFSFDLSVMDLYMSLYLGGTLWCLEKFVQNDYSIMCESFRKSGANVLVSTPSFVNLCLFGNIFNSSLMPNIELFLFCGETLQNKTAETLMARFPKATIVNTYGPTESTVAITEIVIDSETNKKYNPLPLGTPKPGTYVMITDENSLILPEGEKGEILIVGNTVSLGYLNTPNEAFSKHEIDGQIYRSYRTGDKGFIKDGMLFYCGRIDLQIKLNGYRIEIEDIENNLLKLSMIKNAAIVPSIKDGKIISLTAFAVVDFKIENNLKASVLIKRELQKFLPAYMIPKKFIFMNALPMTSRGKVDRRKLMEEI